MLSMLPPWVQLQEGGGGGQQASCLVAKQAVEFLQVLGRVMNLEGGFS